MKPSREETSECSTDAGRKIFISYAQDGLAIASEIREELTDSGFTVFSAQDLQGGELLTERLRDMTAESDLFIALVTPKYLQEYSVLLELAQIVQEWKAGTRKSIIPILLNKNAQVPAVLRKYRALDLSDPTSRKYGIHLLIDIINKNSSQDSSRWDDSVAAESQDIKIVHDMLVDEMEEYSRRPHGKVASVRQQQVFWKGTLVATALSTPGSILVILFFSNVNLNWRTAVSLMILLAVNILAGLVLWNRQGIK